MFSQRSSTQVAQSQPNVANLRQIDCVQGQYELHQTAACASDVAKSTAELVTTMITSAQTAMLLEALEQSIGSHQAVTCRRSPYSELCGRLRATMHSNGHTHSLKVGVVLNTETPRAVQFSFRSVYMLHTAKARQDLAATSEHEAKTVVLAINDPSSNPNASGVRREGDLLATLVSTRFRGRTFFCNPQDAPARARVSQRIYQPYM